MTARWSSKLKYGVIAGLAGGIAEIVWISAYAAVANVSPALVATGVTETALGPVGGALAVPAGIGIHMALAAILGVIVVGLWRTLWPEPRGAALDYAALTAALGAVWALNFLVILPVVNPAFVGLLPYAATLASKLLFGLAMAATLHACERPRAVVTG
jgi:hypothetical protein